MPRVRMDVQSGIGARIPDDRYGLGGQEHHATCALCGKNFRLTCPITKWGYMSTVAAGKSHRPRNVLCYSYSCMRKMDRAAEDSIAKAKKKRLYQEEIT